MIALLALCVLAGPPAKAPPAASALPNGFQSARWGMSRAEVRKLYPDAKEDPKLPGIRYTVSRTLAGMQAEVGLFFTRDGKFARAGVYFEPQADPVKAYKALAQKLEASYGTGAAGAEDGGMAFVTRWSSKTTEIELMIVDFTRGLPPEMVPVPVTPDVVVWYHSLEHAAALTALIEEMLPSPPPDEMP